MNESGKKFDQDKVRMELLSTEALRQIAAVMTFGAKKYDSHNWRKGIAWSRVLGALLRHTTSFLNGEDRDPETGLSHIAHAGCCVMFLLEYERTHPELDDRYKSDFKIATEQVFKDHHNTFQRIAEVEKQQADIERGFGEHGNPQAKDDLMNKARRRFEEWTAP